jgi:hypothetical protein
MLGTSTAKDRSKRKIREFDKVVACSMNKHTKSRKMIATHKQRKHRGMNTTTTITSDYKTKDEAMTQPRKILNGYNLNEQQHDNIHETTATSQVHKTSELPAPKQNKTTSAN